MVIERKKYSGRRGRGRFYLGAAAVIFLMITYVGMQMYIMTLEERIRTVQSRYAEALELMEEREQTNVNLRKGSRIKKIAIEKLGMKLPVGAPGTLY